MKKKSSTLFTNKITILIKKKKKILINFIYQQNKILTIFIYLLTNIKPYLYHNNNYSPNSFTIKIQFSFHIQQLQPNLIPPINLKPSKI